MVSKELGKVLPRIVSQTEKGCDMKGNKLAAIAAVGALGLFAAGSYGSTNDKAKSASGIEQLVPLVGEWEGTTEGGSSVKLTYTLVSNGTALMERMQPSNEPDMLTMYSADGDHILVTHYCSAGNQPQMQSAAITGPTQKFDFSLIRVTGLKKADDGHMIQLVLTLVDKDHLTEEWTYVENGKRQTEKFHYSRKS